MGIRILPGDRHRVLLDELNFPSVLGTLFLLLLVLFFVQKWGALQCSRAPDGLAMRLLQHHQCNASIKPGPIQRQVAKRLSSTRRHQRQSVPTPIKGANHALHGASCHPFRVVIALLAAGIYWRSCWRLVLGFAILVRAIYRPIKITPLVSSDNAVLYLQTPSKIVFFSRSFRLNGCDDCILSFLPLCLPSCPSLQSLSDKIEQTSRILVFDHGFSSISNYYAP